MQNDCSVGTNKVNGQCQNKDSIQKKKIFKFNCFIWIVEYQDWTQPVSMWGIYAFYSVQQNVQCNCNATQMPSSSFLFFLSCIQQGKRQPYRISFSHQKKDEQKKKKKPWLKGNKQHTNTEVQQWKTESENEYRVPEWRREGWRQEKWWLVEWIVEALKSETLWVLSNLGIFILLPCDVVSDY